MIKDKVVWLLQNKSQSRLQLWAVTVMQGHLHGHLICSEGVWWDCGGGSCADSCVILKSRTLWCRKRNKDTRHQPSLHHVCHFLSQSVEPKNSRTDLVSSRGHVGAEEVYFVLTPINMQHEHKLSDSRTPSNPSIHAFSLKRKSTFSIPHAWAQNTCAYC